MRCPLSTWRKKAVEVEFFCSGRCLPWLHYGHQLRCNCEDVWSADGALFLRYCICPFPCCPFPCFVASMSPAEFGQQFSFPQRFAFLSSVLSGLPSLLSTTQPEAVVTFGPVFAVSKDARRNEMRWTTTRSPMMGCSGASSDGSLGLKATDGQGQAEKVDLWLQSKDHSISLHRILLRLA